MLLIPCLSFEGERERHWDCRIKVEFSIAGKRLQKQRDTACWYGGEHGRTDEGACEVSERLGWFSRQ